MDIDELMSERARMAESLVRWRTQVEQAQIQVHIHVGHIERIDWLIERIKAKNEQSEAEKSGTEDTGLAAWRTRQDLEEAQEKALINGGVTVAPAV